MALYFPSEIPDVVKPLTFIHIPKTAGTSFTNWVVTNNIPHTNTSMHGTPDKVQDRLPNLGFTVCFVRNPWDRMVSFFHYVGQQAQHKLHAYATGGKLRKGFDLETESAILRVYRQGFYRWLTLEASGQATAMSQDKTMMNWKQPQWHWAQGCDRVMRMEDLASEFVWLQHYFRCYQPLPRVNTSEHGDYRDYYDPETHDIVAEMYAIDIERFGYVF